MMFRRNSRKRVGLQGIALGLLAGLLAPSAYADMGYAVVPKQIIYPGQEIDAAQLQEVEVTNPNLAGGYASGIDQVMGKVSNRTLLPGRTIQLSALREPYAVKRGAPVRLTFSLGNMTISATGTPLDNAAVGDVIKVRNLDSGVTVSGTVMANGTVQVMAK
ncbi:flagellar biosynthesis protein FlgA [Rhizobium sp. Root149]|jgi:flagella basal body P-ring formation protein FlgA|uniref:Flagella basal body P-ring formation protein FlgA n=4 Tax=Rhizobium TaxID=379 RepID=A0A7W6LF90_9HYPH|nr:flagellar biosynthesis protein FlgA [Rhizobium sp. Root149]MBB4143304.1 flagella basal body P-ring formation protein FlgA [Rhizobium rhizoryzae]